MIKLFAIVCSLLLLLNACTSANAKTGKNTIVLDKETLVLDSAVTDESVGKLIEKMMLSDSKRVTLFINSPGGSVVAGDAFIAALKANGKPVDCIVEFGASMAFVIYQLACDNRYIQENSVLMQHLSSYGLNPGPADQQRTMVDFLEKMVKSLEIRQAKRLKMPLEDFQKKIASNWWIYGTEALEVNAADSVKAVVCSKELLKKTITEQVMTFFGALTVEKSACPLIHTLKIVTPGKENDGNNSSPQSKR